MSKTTDWQAQAVRPVGTSERRERIIQRLRQQGSVQVNALSTLFGVSTVTIRNDLAFIEKQGIALRAYGGALICDNPIVASAVPVISAPTNLVATEPSMQDKSRWRIETKRNIARAAARLITPGHRVILDSGTTTCEIARCLRRQQNVIVMTNGINVASALLEAQGVDLMTTGGHLRRKSLSFYGTQAEQALQNYHFDMLFLGVDAIDPDRGISTHYEEEARLNRVMCTVASRIIAVTDSSKFNRSGLHKIIDTSRIHQLITDDGIAPECLTALRQKGIAVTLVAQ